MDQTALQKLIDISNTLLRFCQVEAEKILPTEAQQQDEFAIGFSDWKDENCLFMKSLGFYTYKNKPYATAELLEIYKQQLPKC